MNEWRCPYCHHLLFCGSFRGWVEVYCRNRQCQRFVRFEIVGENGDRPEVEISTRQRPIKSD